ncbi:MAG TPA: BON domain-containing protein [Gemmatimonadaceae bacterium]|nr:BON domain-containing protein [Gemmatimonadaceae bacterium]
MANQHRGRGHPTGYELDDDPRLRGGAYGRGGDREPSDYDAPWRFSGTRGRRERGRYGPMADQGGYGSQYGYQGGAGGYGGPSGPEIEGGYAGGGRFIRGPREGWEEDPREGWEEEPYRGQASPRPYAGNTEYGGRSPWGGEQGFAGRGPRGYRRRDERIEEDVNEELTRHPGLDATDIEVRVKDGEVVLSGTVHDRHAKRLAEDIAESCAGVIEVSNEIKVVRE